MQKVIYSVTRLAKPENVKTKGVGYINNEYLITACKSKQGNPYVRCYECVKNCHKVENTTNEYKGMYHEIVNIEDRTVEIIYYIWFKYVD